MIDIDALVTNTANEIDQTFRQRHTVADVEASIRSSLLECERLTREECATFQLQAQSREAVEAQLYRYLRDVAGQVDGDEDGPMICAGLGDAFYFLRGEECDEAIRDAIEKHAAAIRGMK